MENRTVYCENIKYRGKANKIKWKKLEEELKFLIGKSQIIDYNNKTVYIGKDFPDEFAGSNYTAKLKGALVKVKANISNYVLELIRNAYNERHQENKSEKHSNDAKNGWDRYDVDVAIPIIDENGNNNYYNYYKITMIVRCDKDGKSYLYDFIDIKKGKCTPLG